MWAKIEVQGKGRRYGQRVQRSLGRAKAPKAVETALPITLLVQNVAILGNGKMRRWSVTSRMSLSATRRFAPALPLRLRGLCSNKLRRESRGVDSAGLLPSRPTLVY